MRPSFVLPIVLSSILLAGSAAADEPKPSAVAPLPPGYGPPRSYYGPPTPDPSTPPRDARRRYSTPMMIAGIVISAVGNIALGLGTTVYVISDSIICEAPGCGPSHGGDTAVMVAGGILSLAGIPLIAVGAHGVPVKPNETALMPKISVSPHGASLTFSF